MWKRIGCDLGKLSALGYSPLRLVPLTEPNLSAFATTSTAVVGAIDVFRIEQMALGAVRFLAVPVPPFN
jgi:hypothetical protein